jgi:hypothetical protein
MNTKELEIAYLKAVGLLILTGDSKLRNSYEMARHLLNVHPLMDRPWADDVIEDTRRVAAGMKGTS